MWYKMLLVNTIFSLDTNVSIDARVIFSFGDISQYDS